VCIALCTIVAHSIAQNRPDSFPPYPPDNHHCSDDVYLREGGHICDTAVHKGQRGVIMAISFGTKIAINVYKCILRKITTTWLLIAGGFRGWQIQRRHFGLQGSKGRCQGNHFLAKIGKNLTKMVITSVVCVIFMQFGFEIGFVLSGN